MLGVDPIVATWTVDRYAGLRALGGRRSEAQLRSSTLDRRPRQGRGAGVALRAAGRGHRGGQQPADVGRLADVLQAVVEHADQPDAQGHRRIPSLVDHTIELASVEATQVGDGPCLHGVVVRDQIRRGAAHRGDVGGRVAVAVILLVGAAPEALVPPVGHVALLGARNLAHLVVLHAGDVPDQPRRSCWRPRPAPT